MPNASDPTPKRSSTTEMPERESAVDRVGRAAGEGPDGAANTGSGSSPEAPDPVMSTPDESGIQIGAPAAAKGTSVSRSAGSSSMPTDPETSTKASACPSGA